MTDGTHRASEPGQVDGTLEVLDLMNGYARTRLLQLLNERQTLSTDDGAVLAERMTSFTAYHYEQWLKALELTLTRINKQIARGLYDLDIVNPALGHFEMGEHVTYANGKCCNGKCHGRVADSDERKTAVIWEVVCRRHEGMHSAVINTTALTPLALPPIQVTFDFGARGR